jgi:hypothetical protein
MCLPNTRQNGNNSLVVKTGHGRQCREEEKATIPQVFFENRVHRKVFGFTRRLDKAT